MKKTCPSCGASSAERSFVGAFCVHCLPIDIKVPHKIKVPECSRCGRIRFREWIPRTGKNLNAILGHACKGKFESCAYLNGEAVLLVPVGSKSIEVKRPVEIAFSKDICTDCSRAASGYFEAIVQLRGDRNRVRQVADKVRKTLEQRSFVPKFEELHEGIDVYSGSRKEAIDLIGELGYGYVRTEKLAGEKNGKRLYRTTLLVRL